ncbi:substrate-binding domain-containing protein [bacterium]|nr:substrate-binding domain-containing protein [bacterium]
MATPAFRHTLCLLLASATLAPAAGRRLERIPPDKGIVRTAVIGGMTMTGLWGHACRLFEAEHPYKVRLVATGPRPVISVPFRAGDADLLTMHSGDITTDLVADGYGVRMRPWTRNDLVILGPPADPAQIKGLADGAQALRRIAEAKAPFIDGHGMGTREMSHKLWKRAGIVPRGDWVIQDECDTDRNILLFAEKRAAYVIVGRMPVLWGRMPKGTMQILVDRDPTMRRPYVVMEANPARFPQANHAGARALADFLLSPKMQAFLKTFGADRFGGIPLFHPVWPVSPAIHKPNDPAPAGTARN